MKEVHIERNEEKITWLLSRLTLLLALAFSVTSTAGEEESEEEAEENGGGGARIPDPLPGIIS